METLALRDIVAAVGGRWIDPGGRDDPPRIEARGVSTDSRAVRPGELFVALRGDRFDGHDFVGRVGDRAVASLVEESRVDTSLANGSTGLVVVDDTLTALERLAAWYRRRLDARVIAITGSVGKTTVKEFTGSILARARPTVRAPKSFNNRIGVALTLLGAERSTRFLVVELGTSAPGEIAALTRVVRPDLALVTGVAAAHLEGLKDLDGVAAAKSEIFEGLSEGGVAFVPESIHGEERFLAAVARRGARLVRFGWATGTVSTTSPASPGYRVARCAATTGGAAGYRFELACGESFRIPVPGRHNVFNAVAAIALARECGLEWSAIRSGLSAVSLPPRRLALADRGGVAVLDDTYNSNPASLHGALETVRELSEAVDRRGRWFVVLGDFLELGASSARLHCRAGEEVARSGFVDKLWTIGEASRDAAAAARVAGLPAEDLGPSDHAEVARRLASVVEQGDGVLFKASRGIGLERAVAAFERLMVAGVRRPGDIGTAGEGERERRNARASL